MTSVGFTICSVNDILCPSTLNLCEEKLPRKKNLLAGERNSEYRAKTFHKIQQSTKHKDISGATLIALP